MDFEGSSGNCRQVAAIAREGQTSFQLRTKDVGQDRKVVDRACRLGRSLVELKKLQDDVPAVPFEAIREQVERELGCELCEVSFLRTLSVTRCEPR